MNSFLRQHAAVVMGALCGWDRLRLRGTLRMLANVCGMNLFLSYTGHLLKEFGNYALLTSRRVRQEALAVAESAGRPVIHLQSPAVNKEEVALRGAAEDRGKEGIIAAITAGGILARFYGAERPGER